MIVVALSLKAFAAQAMAVGIEDLDRFAASPFGSDVSRETPALFLTWTRGDGMAFFAIAEDPLAMGPTLSLPPSPAYRMSRIGYPLFVRALALGRTDWIPYTLTFVNLFGLAVLTYKTGKLTDEWGNRAMLILANPAIWLAFLFDTAELMAILCAVLAISARSQRVSGTMSGFLGLTRPSFATALLATSTPIRSVITGVSAAVLLQVFLVFGLGLDVTTGAGNLVMPFTGYAAAFHNMSSAFVLTASVVLIAGIAAVLAGLAGTANRWGFRLALITTGLLILSLAPQVVDNPVNLLRAGGALPLLAALPPQLRLLNRGPMRA